MSENKLPRVFIGRLSRDVREKDIERLVSKFGDIKDINLKVGYGFVEFKDFRDAEDCVKELNNTQFFNDRIAVELAKGERRRNRSRSRDRGDRDRSYRGDRYRDRSRESRFPPARSTKFRIVVENLAAGVSWQDLKDYMRTAGEVTYADISRDRPGEGVVDFATLDDAKTAMRKLDDTELRGKRIMLREAFDSAQDGDDRNDRRRSRSRSRSPPRRRRSRSPRREREDRRSDDKRDSKSSSRRRSPSPVKRRSDSPM